MPWEGRRVVRATEFPRRCRRARKVIRGRFDALLSASEHGARQTRIGLLDPSRVGWPPRLSRRSPWSSGCDARNRPRHRHRLIRQSFGCRRSPARPCSGSHRPPWRIRRRCRGAPKLGRQIKKKPKSATRRCIKIPPPGGSLPHRKKRFAEPGIDDRRIKKSTQFKHEKMRKFSVINVSSL